jgi:23S rRNA pseudouridine1911/1915/1917 synthase
MVAAKSDTAHHKLVEQFQGRTVEKIYHAILAGIPREKKGRIESAIGRHPVDRKKMSVLQTGGKPAVTVFEVLEVFEGFTFVKLSLETGRTHQIRVHMASIGCPVAGDTVYNRKKSGSCDITRQLLHSSTLSFIHPISGDSLSFTAPLWPDMQEFLEKLRINSS